MQASDSPARATRVRRPIALLAIVFASLVPAGSHARAQQTLTIAAAADLETVMPAIASEFQKTTGATVHVTYGSSGNFATQIQNGAPFDLFMSADVSYPRLLETGGLTEPGSIVVYGTGRIVLWARNGGAIDVSRGLRVLTDPGVRHISIANPEHAPYGKAAVAALEHEGLYDSLKPRLILGENVSQAATFIESGNAEAGIIALSLALSPQLKASGSYYMVPPDEYPALEQAAAIIKSSHSKDAARQFLAFLSRADIVRLMQSYGFALPAPKRDS